MTHEIMNSVAPIASLADSLQRVLRQQLSGAPALPVANSDLLEDVMEGIGIIQTRSEGLLRFSQVYRDFSTITTPVLTTMYAQELFNNIQGLMKPQLAADGIELLTAVEPKDLRLQVDTRLLEQVLINLILNAAYAVQHCTEPRIRLQARQLEDGPVVIDVADNGTGIPPEVLESIFIPFFTTRKGGTGIGLSLAKQIMHLHGGSIKVQTALGEGTRFRLGF
jgi:signal transduction histidine kinase